MVNCVNVHEMKVLDFVVTFCSLRVEKCDNKVNTSCGHIFVAYRGEKCEDKSKY